MTPSATAIRIDAGSSTPVYRQISDAIRALLVSGSLNPGDQLPPVRQLAIDLAVHFNTVAEAYRTLAEEGWLDLRRRRGALVIARPTPLTPPPEAEPKFAQRLRELVAATQSEGLPPETIAQHLRRIAEGLEPCSSQS
jgi:DNA-binding transcriptional regulator YhcF (GntR family)